MRKPLGIVAAVALLMTAALAQGPGSGQGPGKGPGWTYNDGNTRGWSMMSPEERNEHRNKMQSFKSYEECTAYLDQHHKAMEARAKESGWTMPTMPKQNMCEHMKQAGRFG